MEEREFNIDEKLISKAEKEYEDELEKNKITDSIAKSSVDCRVIQPNSFINGDCMEFMRTCPPNFFDLAIVDPPYGINTANQDKTNRGKTGSHYELKNWDASPPPLEYFEELTRISKNQIIWGGNYYDLPPTPCYIVWDKKNGDNDNADCELAWTSFKSATRKVGYRWQGMIQENMKEKENRIHVCQKPVYVYKWILKNYAKAGDLILDTHVGSASSLIACVELGYDYVGFEIDKEYYTMAKSRLGRATRKYELFEAV